ncbi:hypothetical protein BJY01DRAFT_78872 [Aspergillus pseudoustus]|uniref:Uncharacterized protein n=1 Tax=Aspergillus pseudoustus TaxID=1810923 RepID=A0ABR4KLX8_9EURO
MRWRMVASWQSTLSSNWRIPVSRVRRVKLQTRILEFLFLIFSSLFILLATCSIFRMKNGGQMESKLRIPIQTVCLGFGLRSRTGLSREMIVRNCDTCSGVVYRIDDQRLLLVI